MKLLIIDNNPGVAQSVNTAVALTWPEATTLFANTGGQGIHVAASEEPDLITMEVELSDMDGFSVCRQIRLFSDVPIIMMTERSKEADVVQGLNVGADDFILKPIGPIVFVARLRAVLRRANQTTTLARGGTFEYEDLKVDSNSVKVTLAGKVLKLSYIEYRLLCVLMKDSGKTIPRRRLLSQIWGRDHAEDTHYLNGPIKRLRSKLGEDSPSPRYIFTEWGLGYRFGRAS